MVALAVDGIEKRYGGIAALTDVSIQMEAGEVRALVGKNGAGKSTLVNLLSGAIQPDRGQILIDGSATKIGSPQEARRLGIATVHQELAIVPGLDVGDNIMLGRWGRRGMVDRESTRKAASAALRQLGSNLQLDQPVRHLSIASWQVIEIARALSQEVRLVILDEPTSALSSADADVLIATVRSLASRGIAVIYVSHRLDEIPRVADQVTVLRDGAVIATAPSSRLTSRDLVRLMGADARFNRVPESRSQPATDDLSLAYRNVQVPDRVFGVDIQARRGEIVGVAGLVGAGCSELLRSIYGLVPRATGELRLEGQPVNERSPSKLRRAGVAFVSDDRKREGLFLARSVTENITLGSLSAISRFGVVSRTSRRRMAEAAIRRFGIKASSPDQVVHSLSGGNQQKVVVARNLSTAVRVLVLDEPTRGIDVEAKGQMYQTVKDLADAGTAVLVSFSEFDEFAAVCDRVVVLRLGRVAGELIGPEISAEAIATLASEESDGFDESAEPPVAVSTSTSIPR